VGANQTLTNRYALWVDDGTVRLDSNVSLGGQSVIQSCTMVGAATYASVYNSNNAAGAQAYHSVAVGGTTARAFYRLDVDGVGGWSMGISGGSLVYDIGGPASPGSGTKCTLTTAGAMTLTSSITTAAPITGTAGAVKLGIYVNGAPGATGYVQHDIGGVLYKLLAST
jgi:hypothetical protein